MAQDLLPADSWTDGIEQPDAIVNDNARRLEVALLPALSFEATAPGSPAEGDVYVLSAAWGAGAEHDIAYYFDGAWTYWTPYEGQTKEIAGDVYRFDGADWLAYSPGTSLVDTRGKQAIYVAAAGIRPSVVSGCAPLATNASASNMPDIATLDFDPTTIENAQFGLVMPEKWNGGTLSFRFHWSHAATVTNFGVVFGLQAVSVGDSDPIAVAYGTRVDITDTGGTTDDLFISDESAAITVAGTPAGGEMVFFRLSRRAADGGDTLGIDARVQGVTVYCTTDQSTDA